MIVKQYIRLSMSPVRHPPSLAGQLAPGQIPPGKIIIYKLLDFKVKYIQVIILIHLAWQVNWLLVRYLQVR